MCASGGTEARPRDGEHEQGPLCVPQGGRRAGAKFKEGVPTSYPRGQADMGRAGCTQDAHLAGGCLPPEAQDRARAPSGEGRRG